MTEMIVFGVGRTSADRFCFNLYQKCNKNQQNAHFLMFSLNYIVSDMFRTSKCSSSGRFVYAVLWYFFRASIGSPVDGRM
jgi:hypothetical protein